MVHLVLIRPGSTDYDLQGRIQGTLDIPLSEQGRQEADQAVEKLRDRSLKTLYCAPCQSAAETAQIIGQALRIKVKPLDFLRNLNQGLWQGMLVDEVKLKQPKVYREWKEHPENVCPPDGEMLSQALGRIDEGVDKLLKRHRGGAIGLVVSEPMATLLAARLRRSELGDLWKTHNGCNCCEEFELHPTMWRSEVAYAPAGDRGDVNGKTPPG
jgi:broad specificity phosphatase PhoE